MEGFQICDTHTEALEGLLEGAYTTIQSGERIYLAVRGFELIVGGTLAGYDRDVNGLDHLKGVALVNADVCEDADGVLQQAVGDGYLDDVVLHRGLSGDGPVGHCVGKLYHGSGVQVHACHAQHLVKVPLIKTVCDVRIVSTKISSYQGFVPPVDNVPAHPPAPASPIPAHKKGSSTVWRCLPFYYYTLFFGSLVSAFSRICFNARL